MGIIPIPISPLEEITMVDLAFDNVHNITLSSDNILFNL